MLLATALVMVARYMEHRTSRFDDMAYRSGKISATVFYDLTFFMIAVCFYMLYIKGEAITVAD